MIDFHGGSHGCHLHSTVPNAKPDVIVFYDVKGVLFASVYLKDLNKGNCTNLKHILDKVYNAGRIEGRDSVSAKLEQARFAGYVAGVKAAEKGAKSENVWHAKIAKFDSGYTKIY